MWKKVISEVVIVFTIILVVMGISTKSEIYTEMKDVYDTECHQNKPESMEQMQHHYGLTDAQYNYVHEAYFIGNEIEVKSIKTIWSFWIDRFLVLSIYFLLISIISGISSANSNSYWFYFLPITELLLLVYDCFKNRKTRRDKKWNDINSKIVTDLPKMLNNMNDYLGA